MGCHALLQGLFPTQGLNESPMSPALAGGFFTTGGLVAKSCLTLCDPVNCSLPDSSVHGIFQARILEWVAISFSRGSSPLKDRTWVSSFAGRFLSN